MEQEATLPTEAASSLELRDYLMVIRKRRWLIFYLAATVFAIGAMVTFSSPKIYEASTLVAIRQQPSGILLLPTPQGQPQTGQGISMETQRLLVTSKEVVSQAAEKLREQKIGVSEGEIAGSLSSSVEKAGDVIRISAKHTNPQYAHAIANAVAEAFVEINRLMAAQQARTERQLIDQRVAELESELAQTEEEIRRFKEEHRIVDLTAEAEQQVQRYTALEQQRDQLEAELAQQRARLAEIERALATEQEVIPAAVENPVVTGLRKELTDLQLQLISAQARYQEAHPQIRTLRAQIREAEGQLQAALRQSPKAEQLVPNTALQELRAQRAEARFRIVALESQLAALRRYLSEQQALLEQLPLKQFQLDELERKRRVTEQLYLDMLQRQVAARIREGSEPGSAQIIDTGRVPAKPISPRPERTLPFALALGLALALGMTFFIEYLDDTVKTPDDVERRLGMTFLGVIPYTQMERTLVPLEHPKSPAAEAYRTVRSNLKFTALREFPKALLITSAGAGEGKTVTACNLAVVLAQAGHKVLLVDTDLRRPAMHRVFETDNTVGITSYLVGDRAFEEVVQRTETPNLFVVTSGPLPPNPSELLEMERMGEFLQEAKEFADVVLLDSPPAIVVTDAIVLAPRVDGVLLVAEFGRVTREALRQVRHLLDTAQARIVGVVLNKLKAEQGGYYYYYYYYYYYHYGYYGKEGRRSTRHRARSTA